MKQTSSKALSSSKYFCNFHPEIEALSLLIYSKVPFATLLITFALAGVVGYSLIFATPVSVGLYTVKG